VVAEGDDVGAGGEQGAGHVGGQAETVRGVLGVDDHQIGTQVLFQPRQSRRDRVPAGAADHVTQEEDSHI